MEPMPNQLVEENPNSAEDEAMIEVEPPDVEALHRQRIRFDEFFTGPTW
jgi:hypothetical protein